MPWPQRTNKWKKSNLQEPLFFSDTGFFLHLFADSGNCPNWMGIVNLSKKSLPPVSDGESWDVHPAISFGDRESA